MLPKPAHAALREAVVRSFNGRGIAKDENVLIGRLEQDGVGFDLADVFLCWAR
jgi:hypothetical protein